MKKKIKKIISWFFIGAILFFLGRTLWLNILQLKMYDFNFQIGWLIASFFVYLLSFVIGSFSYYYIFKQMGYRLPIFGILRNFIYAQFGSYVPGKFWFYTIQYKFFKAHNITKTDSVVVFALHATLFLAAALVLSVVMVGSFISTYPGLIIIIIIIVVLATLIGLQPRIFYPLANFLFRLTNQSEISLKRRMPFGKLFGVFCIYCLFWLVYGVAFLLLVMSLTQINYIDYPYVIGIIIAANVLGILALFAPSGLGVREGTIALLLTTIFPTSLAVLISIITRVWSSANELLWAGVLFVINKINNSINRYVDGK